MKIGDGFEYVNGLLPQGISNFIGLTGASEKLLEGHKIGVKSFVAELSNGVKPAAAIKTYFGSFGPSILNVLNPMTLIVAGAAMLLKFTSEIVGRYKDLAKEMNISLKQAKEMHDVQLQIISDQKNQFVTSQELLDITKTMVDSRGTLFDLSKKENRQLVICS
jgi:hypothetical protein